MRLIFLGGLILLCSLYGGAALAQSDQWEKIIEAAKKEGKVVASIPPSAELRKLMELTFPKRYGIAVEF
ncbi:MAG TPA: hypothetical protein VEG60_24190, partial [Candidatus Binatia bacterium]|nr:hypothetical protein [Candidatus Binatia bacterium]